MSKTENAITVEGLRAEFILAVRKAVNLALEGGYTSIEEEFLDDEKIKVLLGGRVLIPAKDAHLYPLLVSEGIRLLHVRTPKDRFNQYVTRQLTHEFDHVQEAIKRDSRIVAYGIHVFLSPTGRKFFDPFITHEAEENNDGAQDFSDIWISLAPRDGISRSDAMHIQSVLSEGRSGLSKYARIFHNLQKDPELRSAYIRKVIPVLIRRQ